MLTRTRTPLYDAFFDHDFVRSLPGESGPPAVSRPVLGACWSDAPPTPVAAPRLLAWSPETAALLGLADPSDAAAVAAILSGNVLRPGMRPVATCYGGHQFGQWAGQLGDGRAILLGDLGAPGGQRWEVQLKGAGRTPYSRHADGRAVLRSSLREFVCSEAMHHLGVPTTRALALVGTGEAVVRDMFYDGRPRAEPGAIVTRLAPSFVRFGHFEIFASRGDADNLRRLADHVIVRHFPEFSPPEGANYGRWFSEVARRTAVLVAHWMRVGFVHGVMNTDNLSILGLTIDYGPFGWLDVFDPAFTPNTSDRGGRYAWSEQPAVAEWNLMRLADALLPLVGDASVLEAGLEVYARTFDAEWIAQMLAKLGLRPGPRPDDDAALIAGLLGCLAMAETDWTLFFRGLMRCRPGDLPPDGLPAPLVGSFYGPGALPARFVERLRGWLGSYAARLAADGVGEGERLATMAKVNPCRLPRNYLLHETVAAVEAGDDGALARLLDALRDPYSERPEFALLACKRPEWARNAAGCSALSCSS